MENKTFDIPSREKYAKSKDSMGGNTGMEKNAAMLNRLTLADGAREDNRKRLFLLPTGVVWQTENVSGSEVLLEDRPVQIALAVKNSCTLDNRGEDASILLDFGQELHGGLLFSVYSVSGGEEAKLRIRFGESVAEAMSEPGGESNATNDHACRDMIVTVQRLSMNPVGETGFRFVRIDLLTPGVSVTLQNVNAVLIYRDIPYLGSFRCSDPQLGRIWDVAAYTVHLCMQHYIWDGIKRDRLVWIGDLHPEIQAIFAVFGDQPIIRESLDYAVAQTPKGAWMNGISAYSMWWILIQHDYFLQYGDKDYLRQQLPFLKEVCGLLSGYIGEDGKDMTPEMRFVDWPTQGNPRTVDVGVQSLHVLAARCARRLFLELDEKAEAEKCDADLRKLLAWPVPMADAKQANALAVWAELLDAEKVNRESLAPGGAEGLSTFMGYYILKARADAGDVSGALDTLREYWGGMLKLGATTFWEDFDIRWLESAAPIDRFPQPGEVDVHATYGNFCYKGLRHSLCHGWSAGVAAWLSRYVLGVAVLEPGCRKLRIAPNLCDLEWVEGSYPTPAGVVWLKHIRVPQGIRTLIHVPDGIDVEFAPGVIPEFVS